MGRTPDNENPPAAGGPHSADSDLAAALRESDARRAFLLKLADAIQTLEDAWAIESEATHLLGTYLGADRAFYAEMDDEGTAAIVADYCANGIPSMAGRHQLNSFGQAAADTLRAGHVLTFSNIGSSEDFTPAEKAACRRLGIISALKIPLMRAGRLLAFLGLHSREPRDWTSNEIALATDVAERTWATIERARADAALRESTERLRLALDVAQLGDWDLDLVSGNARTSIRHDRCFGATEPIPDWSYDKFIARVHPDDRADVERKFQAAVNGHEEWHFECRVLWPDETVHWIEAHGRVYHASHGRPDRMLGIVGDITERKHAEAALRESEERFRALARVGSSSVYRMSPDWREMRGLDGSGLLACTTGPTTDWVETYIPPDDRPRVREAIERAIANRDTFELEHRVLCADGAIRWTLSRAIPLLNEAGEIVEWFGAAMDVTERVHADQSFTRLFQASPAPFLVVKPDAPRFTITEVNDAYLAATMRTREEVVGRGIFEAFPDNPDDAAIGGVSKLRASLERVLATHQPDTLPGLKYDIARPDGTFEERWWSPVNSAVLNANGEVEAIIHNANDVTERYRAEAALRESEERFRALASTGANMLYRISPDWSHMYAMDGRNVLAGTIKPDGHWADVFLLPEDQPMVFEVIRAAIRARSMFELEHRIRRADGSVGWLHSRAVPILDSNGKIREWFGSGRDVTLRVQAERAIRENEERQAFLLKLSDTVRALTDMQSIVRTSVTLLAEHMGLDRAYVAVVDKARDRAEVGPAFQRPDLVPVEGVLRLSDFPDAFAEVEARTLVLEDTADDPVLSDRDRSSFEAIQMRALVVASARRGERNPVWALLVAMATPRQWTSGEIALVEEVAERIWAAVERARVEADARRSDARYRALFETVDEGFCIVQMYFDADQRPVDYRILEMNPAFERHTGLVGAAGKLVSEVAPGLEAHWFEIYGQVAMTGEPVHFQEHAETLGGRWFDVRAFRTGEPGERKVAILFNDVTQRKRAEEALRAADRAKDDFLAMLGHELRNPLGAASNALHLIRARAGDEPTLQRPTDVLARQMTHMGRLVDDLLDVARVTQGKIRLEHAPVALDGIINTVLQSIQPVADAKGLEVCYEGDISLMVLGDAVRLEQVVFNLVSNAVKYTNEGSIHVTLKRSDDNAILQVRDTGIGLSPEMAPRVFDLFLQAGVALDRSQGGLGIGLTVVQRMVEMHGGKVAVESDGLQMGSTFTVTLPLLPRETDAPSTTPDSQDAPATGLRILVVDDHEDARTALVDILTMWGHEAWPARDGKEALREARSGRPSVILLDIGLPGMDGYEVARLLREEEALAGVKIVALTGYGQDADRRRAEEAHFDAHMVKPVDLAALERILAQP